MSLLFTMVKLIAIYYLQRGSSYKFKNMKVVKTNRIYTEFPDIHHLVFEETSLIESADEPVNNVKGLILAPLPISQLDSCPFENDDFVGKIHFKSLFHTIIIVLRARLLEILIIIM